MPIPTAFQSEHQQRVTQFMVLAKQECPASPTIPAYKIRLLRARLILEEALETIAALGVRILPTREYVRQLKDSETASSEVTFEDLALERGDEPNLVEIADGCADISVVTIGTLIACGIADVPVMNLVDSSNLNKFGPGHSFRADGKLIKPPDFEPPDFAALIAQLTPAQHSGT